MIEQVSTSLSVTSSQNSTSGTEALSTPGTLDYEAFLQLLVAQLGNQDPTSPQDSTEYVAQLANFSNVEQGIQTNAKLDALLTASALGQAEGIIGRTITSADGTVSGVVSSIEVNSGVAVAVLEDDSRVLLGSGISIS